MTSFQEKDARHIWHPFTQHATEPPPVLITAAKRASLFDDRGNEILDMICSWWTCLHGHSHPAINKALTDQVEKIDHVMFAGFTHAPAAALAEKLARLLPGDLNRVFFSDNGSTAVEVALKLAFQYWKNRDETGRTLFLAFDGAYHGDTVGAMSVGKGCGFYSAYDELLFQTKMLPFVETWDDDPGVAAREKIALAAVEKTFKENADKVAGLIVEPIMQGASGIRLCRPSYIKAVSSMARAHGIPVIYDEVAVGFGRLGTLFACEQIGFTPDLICLSKGLTAGYMPMSVTVATDTLFDNFLGKGFGKAFAHGHSFTANPLACAVAGRSLDLFSEENTLEKIRRIETLHRGFARHLRTHTAVEKVRVHGSIFAFNLKSADGYKSAMGEYLRSWFLSNGLNIRPIGPAVYLMPPYCITEEELARAYEGIIEGLNSLPFADAA